MVEGACFNVLKTLITSKNEQSMNNESKNIYKEWKVPPFWL
jgi:hypothetical protein